MEYRNYEHKNQYEQLFSEMLHQMDVDLVKHGKNAYHLESTAYLLDSTIVQNTDELWSLLEDFVDEMFMGDLDREAINYGLEDFAPHPWESALSCIERYRNGTEQERKFIKDHEWEIQVIDMLCFHLDEVDINHLDYLEAASQVFYVDVRETYHKLVRVIADDIEEAAEKAMDALNRGDIECSEYLEDSTRIEVENREELEEFWCTSVEDVTLIDEQGEVVE